MKNKENVAKQYFKQKTVSIVEIIFIITIIIAGVIATFVQGGGPIGFPVLLIAVSCLIICRSMRIKDSEIDEILQRIIVDNGIDCSGNTIACYELNNPIVKKRKDGKLVSPQYYITNITSSFKNEAVFNIFIIDLFSELVKKDTYTVQSGYVVLVKKDISVPTGKKKFSYIKIQNCDYLIPITLDDYKSSQLIEQICNGCEEI